MPCTEHQLSSFSTHSSVSALHLISTETTQCQPHIRYREKGPTNRNRKNLIYVSCLIGGNNWSSSGPLIYPHPVQKAVRFNTALAPWRSHCWTNFLEGGGGVQGPWAGVSVGISFPEPAMFQCFNRTDIKPQKVLAYTDYIFTILIYAKKQHRIPWVQYTDVIYIYIALIQQTFLLKAAYTSNSLGVDGLRVYTFLYVKLFLLVVKWSHDSTGIISA